MYLPTYNWDGESHHQDTWDGAHASNHFAKRRNGCDVTVSNLTIMRVFYAPSVWRHKLYNALEHWRSEQERWRLSSYHWGDRQTDTDCHSLSSCRSQKQSDRIPESVLITYRGHGDEGPPVGVQHGVELCLRGHVPLKHEGQRGENQNLSHNSLRLERKQNVRVRDTYWGYLNCFGTELNIQSQITT